jgi:uncharacterized repeat protein (TIGR01451 family)
VDACVPNTFTYTISIDNLSGATIHATLIKDALPAGFAYITGSWSVDGVGNPSLESGDEPSI